MYNHKTQRAIDRYTLDVCLECFAASEEGNGASTIGIEHGLTTNQADAAINAGREIADNRRVL